MRRKIISYGSEAQEKFLEGVDTVDDMVGGTLGPAGRNRIIKRKYKAPLVINDGVTVARHMILEDEVADLAAQTLVDVAMNTNDKAGDGTTTSIVIASELYRKGLSFIAEDEDVSLVTVGEGGGRTAMDVWRQIQEEEKQAVSIIEDMAEELTDEDLRKIINTSLEDIEYGDELADILIELGPEAYFSVEDNWATKYGIETDVTAGFRCRGEIADRYFANRKGQKEAVWEDTHILVLNHRLESVAELKPLFKQLNKEDIRKLVIVGGYSEGPQGFSNEFIQFLARLTLAKRNPEVKQQMGMQGEPMEILPVKAPQLTSGWLEDMAAFVGANFVDKNAGDYPGDITLDDLGVAKKVSVTEDEINIIGGVGDPQERIEVLQERNENEEDELFKEKRKRRISALSAGVGVIRVGANTEGQREYLKYKLEDAVLAAKAAYEEGSVPGAGLSFARIADELGEDALLYEPLYAVHERITSNAGGDIGLSDDVLNPAKVDRIALENACSGAGSLITADGAITDTKLNFMDYLQKALQDSMPGDPNDDFRHTENQDRGKNRLID